MTEPTHHNPASPDNLHVWGKFKMREFNCLCTDNYNQVLIFLRPSLHDFAVVVP
jgi:hypothetical protein